MNLLKKITLFIGLTALLQGCGFYSFSGISISPETKSFQVNGFQNTAALVEPGLDRTFTVALQDLILNQTNLDLVTSGGDIVYEGEITRYFIAPNAATSANVAAQNRLTIEIALRFYDAKDPTQDMEQKFSFFYDFGGAAQLVGSQKDTAHEEVFDRITQDIFNATLARW